MVRPVNGELLLANDRSAFSGFEGCEMLEALLHSLKFTSESGSSAQGRGEASQLHGMIPFVWICMSFYKL